MSEGSLRHPLVQALVVFTFTTGLIDAASFLGLGHVFVANMTGNVVLLGLGIAGTRGLTVIGPLLALIAFFLGSVLGGRIAAARPPGGWRVPRAAIVEVGLLALAAVLALVLQIRPTGFSGHLLIAMLAFALGLRNAAVRSTHVADLTTTVVTMTLTALAADSQLGGGSGDGNARRTAAIVAMTLGALAGALLLRVGLAAVLALSALLAVLSWLVFRAAARPPRDRA